MLKTNTDPNRSSLSPRTEREGETASVPRRPVRPNDLRRTRLRRKGISRLGGFGEKILRQQLRRVSRPGSGSLGEAQVNLSTGALFLNQPLDFSQFDNGGAFDT